jgi:hypothetical protein
MVARQVSKLLGISTTTVLVPTPELSVSNIADAAKDSPVFYTLTCIFIILLVAFLAEKALQLFADKQINKGNTRGE